MTVPDEEVLRTGVRFTDDELVRIGGRMRLLGPSSPLSYNEFRRAMALGDPFEDLECRAYLEAWLPKRATERVTEPSAE